MTEKRKQYYYTTLGPEIINRIYLKCDCKMHNNVHNTVQFIHVFNLHNAHAVITISSIICLLIRFNKGSVYILNSFSHLMAFSTLILTLAIVQDSKASFLLNLPPLRNDGIVKNTFSVQTGHWLCNPCLLKFVDQASGGPKCHCARL